MSGHRRRAAAAAARLLLGAATVGAVLLATGHRLPAVPWRAPGDLPAWADQHGPGLAAMAMVHAAVAVGCGFAAALGTLHLLAALLPGRHGVRAAAATRRLTPRMLRVGLGLVAATAATTVPAAASVEHTDASATDAAPDGTVDTAATGTATMTHLGPVDPGALPTTPPDTPQAEAPPATTSPPATSPDRWVVAPGDHLWGIAEETLADRLGRAPTNAEVVPYWRIVIEANRDRLVHPDDPDLILPGQELVLPPAGTVSSGTPAGS